MATITKRNGRWQARVRRKGFPTQTKTFSQKGDAERWVRQTEIQIETHELPKAAPVYPTFEQAVTRYGNEVSRFKKSYGVEKYRLARLTTLPWANKPINQACRRKPSANHWFTELISKDCKRVIWSGR